MVKAGYEERFSRNIGVITQIEQDRLSRAKVAIAGLGGVGGNVLYLLARAGVGAFSLADMDCFSVTNINRQFGATDSTIDAEKIQVVADMASAINPDIHLDLFPEGITADSVEGFLDGVDLVIDAIDFLAPDSRKILIEAALKKGLHVFLAPALGFGASLVIFHPEGPSYQEFFGAEGINSGENVGRRIFPTIPSYINAEAYLKGASGLGYLPTLSTSVMLASTLAASNAILHLLGKKNLARLPDILWLDLIELEFKVIKVM